MQDLSNFKFPGLVPSALDKFAMRTLAFLIGFIGAIATPHSLYSQGGQQAGPPAWLQITLVDVDPANIDEYVALQRDYAARAKRNAPTARTVGRVEVGNTYTFLFITPMQNLASLDAAARNAN